MVKPACSLTSVTVNPKPADVTPPADDVTPPSDDVTPPADDVTPPSDEGTATGSCDAPVDANAGNYAAWDSSKIYNTGDTVSFDHLVWKAKYWTQGNQRLRRGRMGTCEQREDELAF